MRTRSIRPMLSQKLEVQLLTLWTAGLRWHHPTHHTHPHRGPASTINSLADSPRWPKTKRTGSPEGCRSKSSLATEVAQSSSLLDELLVVLFFTTSTSLGCEAVIVRSTEMISSN